MADVILKVKVLQGYTDAGTKEWREPNDVLDMSPDRYAEAVARLARWPGKFLEVVAAAGTVVQAPAGNPAEPPAPAAEKEPAKSKPQK